MRGEDGKERNERCTGKIKEDRRVQWNRREEMGKQWIDGKEKIYWEERVERKRARERYWELGKTAEGRGRKSRGEGKEKYWEEKREEKRVRARY